MPSDLTPEQPRLPTPEQLREALEYSPETGKLFWKSRPQRHFQNKRAWSAWNTRCAGREAFTGLIKGYRFGVFNNKKYMAHRVAWAIYYGSWPQRSIDHINGVRDDNRISNLRDISVADNARNMWAKKIDRALPTGVHIDPRAKKHPYYAAIKVDGKQRRLGAFATVEAANTAYRNAAMQHGFSLRHGERAR